MKWRLFGRIWHLSSFNGSQYVTACEKIIVPHGTPFLFAGIEGMKPLELNGVGLCGTCNERLSLLSKTESK